MIKSWKVTAEVNLCAGEYRSVVVKANTERKARIFGMNALKKQDDIFFISKVQVVQIDTENNENG